MFSKHFSLGSILLVPNLSLLKYFDMTLARHKSFKIEGSGPPLIGFSLGHLLSPMIKLGIRHQSKKQPDYLFFRVA